MPTKLTLTLDKTIIEKAKQYAKHTNRSLSDLVESYLERITSSEETIEEVPKEFEGLFGSVDLPTDTDDKQIVRTILAEKHRR